MGSPPAAWRRGRAARPLEAADRPLDAIPRAVGRRADRPGALSRIAPLS
jgi:hypothetical protein